MPMCTLKNIQGSGPGGRIVKRDIEKVKEKGSLILPSYTKKEDKRYLFL